MNGMSYVAAWADDRNGDSDVYAQSITSFGVLGPFTDANDNPVQPAIHNTINNHPNPFSGRTEFQFQLPKNEQYQLAVYNLKGQKVWQSTSRGMKGANALTWNGCDATNRKVATGVYFSKLTSHSTRQTKKIVVLQ
jgi:hypothetical protein